MSVIFSSDQMVTIDINLFAYSALPAVRISIVYAKCKVVERRPLWRD